MKNDNIQIDKTFCQKVSSASLGGYDVKYNTFELATRAILEGIQGDFVEAGTYKGAHPMIMAEVARRHVDNRKIHLYDSFEGVPKVNEIRDLPEARTYGHAEDGKLESSGDSLATIQHVKDAFIANGAPLENCVFHPGWFQYTLVNEYTNGELPKIALLRLDVDLLASNEVCMVYLYNQLVSGGYFITDDWGKDNTGTADLWREEFRRLFKKYDWEWPEQIFQVENESGTAWWKKP